MSLYINGLFPSQVISIETDASVLYCFFYGLNSGCIQISFYINFQLFSCVFEDNSNNEKGGCLYAKDLKSIIISKCHAKSCITYGKDTEYNIGNFGVSFLSENSEQENSVQDCTFKSCAPFEEPGLDNCRSAIECRSKKINILRNNFSHNHAFMQSLCVICTDQEGDSCKISYVMFFKNTVDRHIIQTQYRDHFLKKVQLLTTE